MNWVDLYKGMRVVYKSDSNNEYGTVEDFVSGISCLVRFDRIWYEDLQADAQGVKIMWMFGGLTNLKTVPTKFKLEDTVKIISEEYQDKIGRIYAYDKDYYVIDIDKQAVHLKDCDLELINRKNLLCV